MGPLRTGLLRAFSITMLVLCSACSNHDRETAHEKAEKAKQKTQQEARKLTEEVRRDARALDQKLGQALNSKPVHSNSTTEAREKLRHGGEELRAATGQAAVKLDRAAMIAKVKAKLATDVGFSTVTSVDVDTTGQVVTLHGTVSSPEQKHQAEQAVLQVNGVSRVINDLRVGP